MSACPEPGGMAITRNAVFIEFTRKKSRLREAKRATRVPPGPILSEDVFAINTILSLSLHPLQSLGNIYQPRLYRQGVWICTLANYRPSLIIMSLKFEGTSAGRHLACKAKSHFLAQKDNLVLHVDGMRQHFNLETWAAVGGKQQPVCTEAYVVAS